MKALEDNRQTRIQLDEQDASINGNEFLNAEMQKPKILNWKLIKGYQRAFCAHF